MSSLTDLMNLTQHYLRLLYGVPQGVLGRLVLILYYTQSRLTVIIVDHHSVCQHSLADDRSDAEIELSSPT